MVLGSFAWWITDVNEDVFTRQEAREIRSTGVRWDRGTAFKVYDDDGEYYFGGYGFGDFEEDVYNWGAWYAGATRVDVYVPGHERWEQVIS